MNHREFCDQMLREILDTGTTKERVALLESKFRQVEVQALEMAEKIFISLAKDMNLVLDAHHSQDWYPEMGEDGEKIRSAHLISPSHAGSLIAALKSALFGEKELKCPMHGKTECACG